MHQLTFVMLLLVALLSVVSAYQYDQTDSLVELEVGDTQAPDSLSSGSAGNSTSPVAAAVAAVTVTTPPPVNTAARNEAASRLTLSIRSPQFSTGKLSATLKGKADGYDTFKFSCTHLNTTSGESFTVNQTYNVFPKKMQLKGFKLDLKYDCELAVSDSKNILESFTKVKKGVVISRKRQTKLRAKVLDTLFGKGIAIFQVTGREAKYYRVKCVDMQSGEQYNRTYTNDQLKKSKDLATLPGLNYNSKYKCLVTAFVYTGEYFPKTIYPLYLSQKNMTDFRVKLAKTQHRLGSLEAKIAGNQGDVFSLSCQQTGSADKSTLVTLTLNKAQLKKQKNLVTLKGITNNVPYECSATATDSTHKYATAVQGPFPVTVAQKAQKHTRVIINEKQQNDKGEVKVRVINRQVDRYHITCETDDKDPSKRKMKVVPADKFGKRDETSIFLLRNTYYTCVVVGVDTKQVFAAAVLGTQRTFVYKASEFPAFPPNSKFNAVRRDGVTSYSLSFDPIPHALIWGYRLNCPGKKYIINIPKTNNTIVQDLNDFSKIVGIGKSQNCLLSSLLSENDKAKHPLALVKMLFSDVPAAPAAVQTRSSENQQVTLKFRRPSPNGSPITTYVVYDTITGTETQLSPINVVTSRYGEVRITVSGLKTGDEVKLKVAAVNSIGQGPSSEVSNNAFVGDVLSHPICKKDAAHVAKVGCAKLNATATTCNGQFWELNANKALLSCYLDGTTCATRDSNWCTF